MKPRPTILLAALLALLAKLYCAATTVGTNDADAFYNFGRFIWEHGLLAQYRATPEFNHTPFVGWFCAGIYGIGHGFAFNWLLRLPGIVADFCSVGILLRWRETKGHPPGWAVALFALSPVNFMVSGFHGNADAVLAWLLLLAVREGARDRAAWCGLFFGLACQVKIIPLLLAPAFFFFWFARGRARPFFLASTVTIIAGWAVPLFAMPEVFLHNVLGYSSNWGSWGVTFGLHATGWPAFAPVGFQGLTPWQTAIMSAFKWLIIGAALWLGWRRRHRPASELSATLMLIWAVFFVCAPGVGAQYLVWFAPLILLHAPRWFVAVTAASSVFLFAFYTTTSHGLPWNHGVSTAELLPQWVAWSILPWLTLAGYLAWSLTRREATPAVRA
jgi:uncharacterized membrane protein